MNFSFPWKELSKKEQRENLTKESYLATGQRALRAVASPLFRLFRLLHIPPFHFSAQMQITSPCTSSTCFLMTTTTVRLRSLHNKKPGSIAHIVNKGKYKGKRPSQQVPQRRPCLGDFFGIFNFFFKTTSSFISCP